MNVVFSRFSRIGKTDGIEPVMAYAISSDYPDVNFDNVTLHVSNDINPKLDEDQFKEGMRILSDQIVTDWRLDYPDSSQPDGIRRIKVENTPYLDYTTIIQRYASERDCSQHDFTQDTHSAGSVYQDGRAKCKKCGYQRPNVMDVNPASQLAKTTLSSESQYPTIYDWRDPVTGKIPLLQGGDSGIVLGKESYTTAFFEAFPTIGGLGTFIRGEGASLLKAENAAWEKYQRQSSCPEHKFSRTVHGRYRTNGSAQCTECGFFSSQALPPETTCECCGIPTNNIFKDKHLCFKHYFATIPLEQHIDEYYESVNQGEYKRGFFSDKNEVSARQFFVYELQKWVLQEFCGNDATMLEKIERELKHLSQFISRVYDHRFIDPKLNDDKTYPDYGTEIRPHLEAWFDKVKVSGILNEVIEDYLSLDVNDSEVLEASMFDAFS